MFESVARVSESVFVEKQLEAIGYRDNIGRLPVVEIFKTLQGEGVRIGVPSVFVRLAVCNLACVWCDTKYTWRIDLLKQEKIRWLSIVEIADEIDALSEGKIKNVVFTGGEPVLWWDRGLMELCLLLGEKGYLVEIETNGTIYPNGCILMPHVRFNVSFKLGNNKANSFEERIKPDVLKAFNELGQLHTVHGPRVSWKIVITSREDLEELIGIFDDLGLDKSLLVLMPEGTSREKLESYSWLAEWCRDSGIRFINRLHIALWGDKRGV